VVKAERDISIDGLRGFAIMCMFYAHLIPHFMESGTQLFFCERVVSSIAAPLFLFLVGYNFNIKQDLKRVLKRMLVVLVVAGSIDTFIWHIFPFYSFDVLYLIGISLAFLFLIRRFNTIQLIILVLSVLLISVSLQQFGFYSIELNEPYFNEEYQITQVVYNFFINGWFPFFPWIIFPILGLLARTISFNALKFRVISSFLFLAAIPLLILIDFNWRTFAVEIFYPASWIYLSFALVFLFFIWTNKSFLSSKLVGFLVHLGKTSLFLYIFHLSVYAVIGDYVISTLNNRFICYFMFLFCFWLIAFLLNKYKTNWRIFQKSEVLQILLGR
jgi:uncharacterized membrane protein